MKDVIGQYFINNYVLLTMIAGMFFLIMFDAFLEKKQLFRLKLTLTLLFVLSISDALETYMGELPSSDIAILARTFFAFTCYSLRPIILMMIVFITDRHAHWLITIPASVNILISFSAFFTGIAYEFRPDNVFHRGPLGFSPHIVSIIYIAGWFTVAFRVFIKRSLEEGSILFFLAIVGSIAALLAADHGEIITPMFGAEILLYYLFIYAQSTKRDALTGLLNRQSFYSDLKKHSLDFSGVISIDMNELKWLNDTMGHAAGDKALKTIADCMVACSAMKDRCYRVGGDEYMILCRNRTPEELEQLADQIHERITKEEYSCAIGISANKPMEEMLKEADGRMYEDKAKIKAEIVAKGGALHPRN